MTYVWHDLLGNIGVLLIVMCYLLLQMGRLSAERLSYSLANGLGAFLILVSLAFEFNLSAFLMEGAWLLVSIYGVLRYYGRLA